MDRTLWPSVILLLVIFGLFEITGIDLWMQDHCYNFSTGAWLVDAKASVPRLLCYTGPKALIWALGIGLLVLARHLPAGAIVCRFAHGPAVTCGSSLRPWPRCPH